jgi:hypothetical protein
VFLGDNATHKIFGQGMVTIKLLNGIKKPILEILHVLRLKNNLFSMKYFDKVGGQMHIKQRIFIFIKIKRYHNKI